MKKKKMKLLIKSVIIVVTLFAVSIFSLGLSGEILPDGVTEDIDDMAEMSELEINYIRDNIDRTYIKNISAKPLCAAQLTVKSTYIDFAALNKNGASLDEYFASVHKTGELNGYIMTATTLLPLYEFDESSSYVVGCLAGAMDETENEVLDIAFAENNDEGRVLDSEHYDENTGLIYIQKCDLYKLGDNCIYTDYVQAQVLYSYKKNDTESSTSVSIAYDGDIKTTTTSDSVINPETIIELGCDEAIKKEDLDIWLNGESEKIDEGDYELRDGTVTIKTSPANITSAAISIDSEAPTSGIFAPSKAYAYTTSTADSGAFPSITSSLKVGDYCDFTASWTNSSGKNDNPSTYDAVQVISGNASGVQRDFYNRIIAHDAEATRFVTGEYASGKANVYKPSSSSENTYRDYKLVAGSIKPSDASYNNVHLKDWLGSIACSLSLSCAEVKTAASVPDGEINLTAMVSEVGSNYALITFCSAQRTEGRSENVGTGQVLCGTFAIKYSVKYAKINYYANGGKTTSATHGILSSGLICKDGAVFYDNWELNNTKKNGLCNASDFGLYKAGYHFTGYWNTSSDGSGSSYGEDDRNVMFKTEGRINLYAQWEENETRISYDVNEGYWPATPLDEAIVKYSESYCIPILKIEEEPKREGYAFMGWQTEGSDKTFDFTDELKPANEDVEDVVLVALWQKASQNDVVYSEYGDSKTYENADVNDSSKKFILPAKHHYYKFVGYFTEDGKQVTDEDGIILYGEIKGVISNGALVNTGPLRLVAHFS